MSSSSHGILSPSIKFERLCFQSGSFGSYFIVFGTELHFITNVDGRYDTRYALSLYNYNLRTIGPRGFSVSQPGSAVCADVGPSVSPLGRPVGLGYCGCYLNDS